MSGPAFEDVEALLDSAAKGQSASSKVSAEHHNHQSQGNHDSLNGRRRKNTSSERGSRHGDEHAESSAHDGPSNRRRRSRSRESHRSRRPRESDDILDHPRSSADHYRGNGRPRSRSRSPRRDVDRHYRPRGGPDRRDRDEHRGRGDRTDRRRSRSPRQRKSRSPPRKPQLSEEERDRRTVFVQQLAARLRTKELQEFFAEFAGPVIEAQIVKDRVSKRSKGVGYVEFESEDSVQKAIQLTGRQLAGIPIIVQLTEAEKNRQSRAPGEAASNANSVPFHRLYVGNIHFSITEEDLQNVFEPFGELEFVQLQKEEGGRSRGYGFVQFREPEHAKEALDKMNGFELAGRPIRVGLGNDKFTPESTANHLQRFPGQGQQQFQGSNFSGAGGRGAYAGGAGANSNFDRAGGRDNEKASGGASALDDTDVSGVNYNNYNRNDLMRKLARTDEPAANGADKSRAAFAPSAPKPAPAQSAEPSRCIVLHNMFDPVQEAARSEDWVKELESETREECEEKYGHVMHISVDPNSAGDVYLKFDRAQGGDNAIKGLNGRYFAGQTITAQPMVEAIYNTQFPRSKNL